MTNKVYMVGEKHRLLTAEELYDWAEKRTTMMTTGSMIERLEMMKRREDMFDSF